MTNREHKILATEIRIHKLKTNGRNADSPGVINKLQRKLRNLKKGEV